MSNAKSISPVFMGRAVIGLVTAVMLGACASGPSTGVRSPWQDQDLSVGQVPGSAVESSGPLTIRGTMDVWGVADGSHLVWKAAHGDVTITACVSSIDNPGGMVHAKASICIRDSLAPGARHVTLCDTAGDGTQVIYRDQADGNAMLLVAEREGTATRVPKAQMPCWLRLVRHGNEFTAYESPDGSSWTRYGHLTLDLHVETVVGCSASSHKPDALTTVTWSHLDVAHHSEP
jgi:hypothetical protein